MKKDRREYKKAWDIANKEKRVAWQQNNKQKQVGYSK